MQKQIYLDNNSTTPIDLTVADRIHETLRMQLGNPASQHHTGQRARRILEGARLQCLRLLGADVVSFPSDLLIFTSGGTESNNLAILGLARPQQQVLVSAIEHPSVLAAAESLIGRGVTVTKIPVNHAGFVDPNWIAERIQQQPTSLVSVMTVNNETGAIQPIRTIAEICREAGVLFHTDAVQAVGKIPVSFREFGVDLITFAPHKFHGPRGIGGLILRPGLKLRPLFFGGVQQREWRPGTEDVALTLGCEMALGLAIEQLSNSQTLWHRLRAELLGIFEEQIQGTWSYRGVTGEYSPHTLNVSFPGVDRQSLMLAADVAGIALSTGSACASGSSERSPVLVAMGLDDAVIDSSIRLSFGRLTTVAEVKLAAERISRIVNDLRA